MNVEGHIKEIKKAAAGIDRPLRLMEVCGTHTVSIFRAGIRQILPSNVALVSGPGCPVCVTDDAYIDKAIAYALEPNTIIATFGDMLKVPGSCSSLSLAQAEGADIRIVYSPLDAVDIARDNPERRVIFLAVGFETTAPTAAAAILTARSMGLKNFFALSAHKLVPPIMRALLDSDDIKVDGFLLPGHVAVVIGAEAFGFLPRDYRISGVVAGFEPEEILRALARLLRSIEELRAEVFNEYESVVREEGNRAAQSILDQVYEICDADWRGIGRIARSGLRMREEFAEFDVERVAPIEVEPSKKNAACRCGEVLRGAIEPRECPLFARVCEPLHPIGPCMVSVEGVCAAWYRYNRG